MEFVVPQSEYSRKNDPEEQWLRRVAALNRINALSCIKSAEHGWLGASYSITEVLSYLYFSENEKNIVLSKGHAAAMQYACLYGIGIIDRAQLLSYKDGPKGLQAHTDRSTPGILVNTGSLGQALSKTAGMAFAHPGEQFFVVLGDGELQEGQNFEAFQTIVSNNLLNLTIIVDQNSYQTSRPTSEIKSLNIPDVVRAFGFKVFSIDGHDFSQIGNSVKEQSEKPKAIIARTIKAGGSQAITASGDRGKWHGQVPDDELYLEIIEEQLEITKSNELFQLWKDFKSDYSKRKVSKKSSDMKNGSTGEYFSIFLRKFAEKNANIVILDADLAAPCGLEPWVNQLDKNNFIEMGISEQDMVSFAGGLSLSGKIPVVHTYASFFRRAYDQIFVNQTEKSSKVIYAGHYAGLSYYSDGKTHQSLNDLSLMRTVPGLIVIDPVDKNQLEYFLKWALFESEQSVYFRLRRMAFGVETNPVNQSNTSDELSLNRPIVLEKSKNEQCFFTAGPLATQMAIEARKLDKYRDRSVVIQSVFGHEIDAEYYHNILSGIKTIVTIEDGVKNGGLYSFCCDLCQNLGLQNIRVQPISVEGFGPSFRSFEECVTFHNFKV